MNPLDYILAFVDKMMGGPAKPTPERDANLAAWQEGHESEYHHGAFPASSLTPEEGWYLRWLEESQGRNGVWYIACNGTNADINRARNQASYTMPDAWNGRGWFTDNTRFATVPALWP